MHCGVEVKPRGAGGTLLVDYIIDSGCADYAGRAIIERSR